MIDRTSEEPSDPPPATSLGTRRPLQLAYCVAGLGAVGAEIWTASLSLWVWMSAYRKIGMSAVTPV
jgi:hypothetical protein